MIFSLIFQSSDIINGVFTYRKWQKIDTLNVITEAVHDLAFSPNLGRSYHMLAVATKDVRIMTLKPMRYRMHFLHLRLNESAFSSLN